MGKHNDLQVTYLPVPTVCWMEGGTLPGETSIHWQHQKQPPEPSQESQSLWLGPINILNPHLLDIPLDPCHGNKMVKQHALQETIPSGSHHQHHSC